MEVDRARCEAQFGGDLLLALTLGESERDRGGGRASSCFTRGLDEAREGGVLLGCGVFDACQLVHL